MRRMILLAALLGAAVPLRAEPGLPDAVIVGQALDEHPSVIAAHARLDAARAEARARARGNHEFTFTGMYIKRSVDREGNFDEYDAQLTRPLRLPGKAGLDREIGEYGVEAAENMAEDARHQAALLLSGYWFDWLAAGGQAGVDQAALANYERALAGVQRRRELGDASQLEVDQAQAALGAARVLAEQSSGQAALARARLTTQFPGLLVPDAAPEIPPPAASDQQLVELKDLVASNSHEIAAAEAEARRRQAMAQRAGRDRVADPSLGLRLFSERNGAERGAGVVFSIPLGGGHRKALADQAEADASAARAEAQLARYNVRETAEADLTEARYRLAAWRRAREALDAQLAALLKLRRGYELGEIELYDLLLGERTVHDAFRSEALARADGLRAVTRLRIDSHELWLAD